MRLSILLFYLIALPLSSEPEVNEITKTYDVKSNSIRNLLNTINHASPIKQNGLVYHGYTSTRVKWNYWWKQRRGYCKINRVKIKVTISYTLPELNTDSNDVKQVWAKYYPALLLHENGHGQIAIDAAKEIETKLLQLPGSHSCEQLSEQANASAKRILELAKPKHQDYDQKTEHGKTQGGQLSLYKQ